MFYKVKATFEGRLFGYDGRYEKAESTSVDSCEETLYIPEDSIIRIDETNKTISVSTGISLDIYKLKDKDLESLIRRIDFR